MEKVKMNKWINIDEQQPTEEQEYLCVCEDGCYWLGMWQEWEGDNGEFCMVGTNHATGSIAVTYWQELPKQLSDEIIDGERDNENLCFDNRQ